MRTANEPSRTAIRRPSGLTARMPFPAIRWSSSPVAVSNTTVGPNPLAYSREPSGENFTAPNCRPARARGSRTADIQIQEHRVGRVARAASPEGDAPG